MIRLWLKIRGQSGGGTGHCQVKYSSGHIKTLSRCTIDPSGFRLVLQILHQLKSTQLVSDKLFLAGHLQITTFFMFASTQSRR
jgi:hypothetical protein